MTILSVILAILFLFLLSFAVAGLSFAPWVPCRSKDLERIFRVANLQPGEKFYDLGCGDGKTVFYAAKNFNVKATGIEMSIPMFLTCQIRRLIHHIPHVQFKFDNFFRENLSDADVVYFFGMPDTIKNKLKKKLEKELKPGSRVISYAFSIAGWEPFLIDKPTEKDISIFLYKR